MHDVTRLVRTLFLYENLVESLLETVSEFTYRPGKSYEAHLRRYRDYLVRCALSDHDGEIKATADALGVSRELVRVVKQGRKWPKHKHRG